MAQWTRYLAEYLQTIVDELARQPFDRDLQTIIYSVVDEVNLLRQTDLQLDVYFTTFTDDLLSCLVSITNLSYVINGKC